MSFCKIIRYIFFAFILIIKWYRNLYTINAYLICVFQLLPEYRHNREQIPPVIYFRLAYGDFIFTLRHFHFLFKTIVLVLSRNPYYTGRIYLLQIITTVIVIKFEYSLAYYFFYFFVEKQKMKIEHVIVIAYYEPFSIT